LGLLTLACASHGLDPSILEGPVVVKYFEALKNGKPKSTADKNKMCF